MITHSRQDTDTSRPIGNEPALCLVQITSLCGALCGRTFRQIGNSLVKRHGFQSGLAYVFAEAVDKE